MNGLLAPKSDSIDLALQLRRPSVEMYTDLGIMVMNELLISPARLRG
jgi:hypothetical protein